MPGAAAWRYSAHGESELKKLVLGVHCIVWGAERAGPYVSQPGPGHWSWSLVSVVWSRGLVTSAHWSHDDQCWSAQSVSEM